MLSVWRHSDAICAHNWNLWEIYSPRRGRRLYCHMSQKWPKYLYWFKGVKIIWIDWWECCLSGSEAIPVYSICCNVQYREEQMGDPNPFFDLFYLHRPFKRQCYKIKGRLLIYLGMHNAYFWLNLLWVENYVLLYCPGGGGGHEDWGIGWGGGSDKMQAHVIPPAIIKEVKPNQVHV